MTSNKVQTPLFSRGSVLRRSSEMTIGSGKNSSTKVSKPSVELRNLEDANLRLVQFVISEREACKVLAEMCLEASARLDITDTEYRIDDIMSGILILGNLYKRVGNEKIKLEAVIETKNEEYTELETSKNAMIERLENAILRLQQENDRLQETITEMKHTHSHKMINAMKEIHEHKEAVEAMRAEKTSLHTRITQQERKLMEVPRMEEQYQRNARGIVRQQEVANTLKEIGWKKLEEEVKSLQFWKSKAKVLEETVARMKVDLENMTSHNRISLSRYQTLLVSYNAMKQRNPKADTTMYNILTGLRPATATTLLGDTRERAASPQAMQGNISSMSLKRPISAPVTRTPTNATNTSNSMNATSAMNLTVNTNHANTLSSFNTTEGITEIPDTVHAFTEKDVTPQSRTRTTPKATNVTRTRPSTANNTTTHTIETLPSFKKSLYNITAGELEKLRDIIVSKDEIITKLSRKLSHARAYPLKGAALDATDNMDSDDEPIRVKNTLQNNTNHNKNSHTNIFNHINEEDVDSETESFLAEEEACHEKRVTMALDIQRMKNERAVKKKAANPPHIRAIREAKSFAESVTEKFNITR